MSWRVITVPLTALLGLIVLYTLWALIAYRDIPVAVLEQKYGGDDLRVLEVEGVHWRYKIQGSGPALLLLHSHFWTMRQWQPWVDLLAHRFTLIRFDLTSHGLTGPDPEQNYSREKTARFIDALLQQNNIQQVAVVGSSTGGAIAFHYAATRPQRVTQLVMMNTPGLKVSNKVMDRGILPWVGYAFYLMPTAVFRPFLEYAVVDKSLITDQLVEEFHQMYRREGNRMGEYYRMAAWEKADPKALLAKIVAPTLIMWGEQNPQLPLSNVKDFEQSLIRAASVKKIIYPNVGHVIPVEVPEQSARDVEQFIIETSRND